MFKNLCCKNTVQYIYSYVTRACDQCLNLSSAAVEWENLAFRKLHQRSQAFAKNYYLRAHRLALKFKSQKDRLCA